MKVVTPIVPGYRIPFTNIAEHQKQYNKIPAYFYRDQEGTILFRWKLSMWERLKLLWTGNLYHWVLTFNQDLQPIRLSVDQPNFDQEVKKWENTNNASPAAYSKR